MHYDNFGFSERSCRVSYSWFYAEVTGSVRLL